MSKADQYIAKVKKLPPAPTVVNELLRLFGDPDHDLDRVVELISLEPSLTLEVLRLCNSATFAGSEPVGDVFGAVSRLGFYEVYCVVTAVMGSRVMAMTPPGALDRAAMWRHSVAVGVSSGVLARLIGEPEATAFTAGLLHDIGKSVLSTVELDIYGAVLQSSGGWGDKLVAAEQSRFGTNHAEIGGRLMARWSLPPTVASVVMAHHQSPVTASRSERLAAVVQVANLLAHRDEATGQFPEPVAHELLSLERTGLTVANLPELAEDIQVAMARVQGLLNMVK